jgi:hypothetical protein
MTPRVLVGAALIGIGLAAAVISWGRAIWQQFNRAIDESWDAEMRQVMPELFDEEHGP